MRAHPETRGNNKPGKKCNTKPNRTCTMQFIIVFHDLFGTIFNNRHVSLPQDAGNQTNYIKFLQEHPMSCNCGICFSPETKLLRFFSAVLYARYVYIEQSSDEAIRTIFQQLLAYWEDNRNDKSKFPRNDMFYFMSARMLLYAGHYYWKHTKDKETAVTLLKRGLKGLNKVKHGTFLIKQDLELQIKGMEDTIKEMQAPREKKFLRTRGPFKDQSTTNKAAALNNNIKIYGGPTFYESIPQSTSQYRSKKAEDVPARTTSKPSKAAAERAKRNLIPTIFIDLDSDSEGAKDSK